jgi:phosphatidate cytidylyltransferase
VLINRKQIVYFWTPQMAFNFRSLGVRSLSALVFVVLLLGSVTWNYLSFSLFFLVVAMGALHEFYNIMDHMALQPFRRLGYLGGLLLYGLFINTGVFTGTPPSNNLIFVSIALPLIISAASIFSRRPHAVTAAIYTTSGLIYCVLPFALLHKIVIEQYGGAPPAYEPGTLLGVILLIWSNDTFAYLVGNLTGRHKMIPRVSPGSPSG